MADVASPADPLGYDMAYIVTAAGIDLDPSGRAATGLELVDAAIVARLTCESLPLIGAPDDSVEFGDDVRKWIGEPASSVATKGPRVGMVLMRDERIPRAVATVSAADPGTTFPGGAAVDITIAIDVTTSTGAILSRVVGVSRVTVAFLASGS